MQKISKILVALGFSLMAFSKIVWSGGSDGSVGRGNISFCIATAILTMGWGMYCHFRKNSIVIGVAGALIVSVVLWLILVPQVFFALN